MKLAYANIDLHLDLAGIFYRAAWEHIVAGRDAHSMLLAEMREHAELVRRYRNLFAKAYGPNQEQVDSMAFEDAFTDAVQSLGSLEAYYEPVVRHHSLAIINLVATVEAYINEVGGFVLEGKAEFNEFDKLSVTGKWVFLPRLMGLKTRFELGKRPLQTVAALLRQRNRLVHYKSSPKKLGLSDPPTFLVDFGLRPDDVQRAFEGVRQLIREFKLAWVGAYGPDWLYIDQRPDQARHCFYIMNVQHPGVLATKADRNKA